MSSSALPITPARFAAALPDLSLASLHTKAAEIHNSIAHLLDSNKELEPEREDADCAEAIAENEEVIGRMRERLNILKREVEGRGAVWVWGGLDELAAGKVQVDGHADGLNGRVDEDSGPGGSLSEGRRARETARGENEAAMGITRHDQAARSGTLTDEELARRIQQQMEDLNDNEDEGMHL